MDSHTTVQHLKEKVQSFCEERDWDQYHNAKDLAIHLVIESSELLDLFRYKSPEQVGHLLSDMAKREKVAEEMADILYLLLRFAQRFNFDLSAELESKMKKNAQKYPVERVKGLNMKYNEY